MRRFFITGIGTDVGKTVASAILTQHLGADYWKPIQAGNLEHSDTDWVRSMVSSPRTHFFSEAYRLQQALSPHAAAAYEGKTIDMNHIKPPSHQHDLIIEGAGGLLVPLNTKDTVLELILHLQSEAIIVSRHYLGSINHTLMTVQVLKSAGIHIKGIVFNGNPLEGTESIILNKTKLRCLLRIPELINIDRYHIEQLGREVQFD